MRFYGNDTSVAALIHGKDLNLVGCASEYTLALSVPRMFIVRCSVGILFTADKTFKLGKFILPRTRKGDRNQYIDGLEDVKALLKGQTEPVVLHTDHGSVYASMAYNDIIKDTVIVRSMSRAGKPTDNPVNESINGWMKEELYMDFKIDECRHREEFMEVLEKYVDFYNKHRPCYALGYDTPVNYRKRFFKGELERKNTFENRVLSEEPKFVQKRRKQACSEVVSTFENENW